MLSVALAFLELGENSTESSARPKLAVAQNEKWAALKRKTGELDPRTAPSEHRKAHKQLQEGYRYPRR
jgi:hypothetical protein